MIIEELLKKKKRVILITHSYILASFGQKNGFPAYDFDTKKMSKDYVPKL